MVIDLDWTGRGHRLRGRDGEMLSMSRDWRNTDRLNITPWVPAWDPRVGSGCDPRTLHHLHQLQITCAVSRGPERIAKDIRRRIIPEYLPKLAEAKASADADEADHLYREGLAAALLPLLRKAIGSTDVRRYTHTERAREATWHWYKPNDGEGLGRGKVSVTSYGLNVDISGMDPAMFMRMLEAVMPAEVHQ